MIYVMAGDYRQFQNFLQHFHLREDFGGLCHDGSCKRGQARYLGDNPLDRQLRGNRNALVLYWGTWPERRDRHEVEDTCRAMDIPMVEVPDLHRERAIREQPERFRRW